MKNEMITSYTLDTRKELDEPLHEYFICNCVTCDRHEHKLLKDAGTSKRQLENGRWSKETSCDVFEITCSLDREQKGYVFSIYERLEPAFCPMHPNNQVYERKAMTRKEKTSLMKKFFPFFKA